MSEFEEAIQYLETVGMNEERFLGILTRLIGVVKDLQNSPDQGLIPKEDLAADIVLETLAPYSEENGGVLKLKKVNFVEGRANVMITYPGTTDKVCSFVGSHLDVVPANPAGWTHDPFTLRIEGDQLHGRGTTDCLGHVAMLTDLMATLAEKRVVLKTTVVVVFIANEENSSFEGIGVDQLVREGYMEHLLAGPLFWIDSADTNPCIGTAGMLQWRLKCNGKLFHSGMPHRGINSVEFAMDVVDRIQQRFFQDFPRLPQEDEYNFATSSTLKPTQIRSDAGAINQIPSHCIVEGDVRLSPFYDVADVITALRKYVDEINADPTQLENPAVRGPYSKYTLPTENRVASVDLKFISEGENGIACHLTSPGHKALRVATEHVVGKVAPYAIGGSLPLVRSLQGRGFDVQIAGYGLSARYHADNEYASLKDMKNATKIMSKIVSELEKA
jgi:acetylornithine deacetylase